MSFILFKNNSSFLISLTAHQCPKGERDINIGPGVFILAGLTVVLIALATVSWRSVKAALANPVDSLRNE